MKNLIDKCIHKVIDMFQNAKAQSLALDAIVGLIILQLGYGIIKIDGKNPVWSLVESHGWDIAKGSILLGTFIGIGIIRRRVPKVLEQRKEGKDRGIDQDQQ